MPRRLRHGAERSERPSETLARIAPIARAIGVTRLADVTGLDTIGIPVFQAIRPLARSLSVSQGKGPTRVAARVSALMEAIELYHAETHPVSPPRLPEPAEAAFCTQVRKARGQRAAFDPAVARSWCAGVDLLSGVPITVPRDLVSMDFARPLPNDLWPSSNGLASGNSHGEALAAALAELIERDAQARWEALDPAAKLATAIDPATIDDRLGQLLIARVRNARLALRLWDLSDAHGVAVIGCAIFDAARDPALPPLFGAGCYPVAAIALARAICEAAQGRVTLIAGARDDVRPRDYADPAAARSRLLFATLGFSSEGGRHWRDVPDRDADDPIAFLTDRVRAAGAGALACITLTRPAIGIDVVKLIAPGLGDQDRPVGAVPALVAAG